MAKKKEIDLKEIKPSARKRNALARSSAARARKAAQFANAASAVLQTEAPGLLQPETDLERTFKVHQDDILSQVDATTASKAAFHLDLEDSGLSPYGLAKYSRSGMSLLIASSKGHVAVSNWREASLRSEIHLNETVRDATFLHNDAFFATSQRKFAYIYDSSGAQVHVLRNHREPGCMHFLPHHLLLASASHRSAPHKKLCYTDTSTGGLTAELDFGTKALKVGHVTDSALNYSNGVAHLSHSNGVVTLWSPVVSRPLAQIFTHAGGVRNVAVAANGKWMVTTGADCTVKVWDLRTYKLSSSWRTPAHTTALTTSQRGLVGLSFGAKVQIWAPFSRNLNFTSASTNAGGARTPYMSELHPGKRITNLDFCPFEDMLAVCHETGMRTMVVPGAGEPTFDSRAPNPYETRKQRRENEVRTLLDKLPAASIALDPSFVGGVESDPTARLKELRERMRAAASQKIASRTNTNRAKGRNKISKRLRRKQANIIDSKKVELQEKLERERQTRDAARKLKEKEREQVASGLEAGSLHSEAQLPAALSRFISKKR